MATSQKGSSNKKNTNSRPAAKKSGGSRTSAPRGTSGAKKTAQRTAKTAKNSAAVIFPEVESGFYLKPVQFNHSVVSDFLRPHGL